MPGTTDSNFALLTTRRSADEVEVSVGEVELPHPVDPDDVVLRMLAAPINPSDIGSMLGPADPGTARQTPAGAVLQVPDRPSTRLNVDQNDSAGLLSQQIPVSHIDRFSSCLAQAVTVNDAVNSPPRSECNTVPAAPAGHRGLDRLADHVGADTIGNDIPEHTAGMSIPDRAQIPVTLTTGQTGDVSQPHGIGPARSKRRRARSGGHAVGSVIPPWSTGMTVTSTQLPTGSCPALGGTLGIGCSVGAASTSSMKKRDRTISSPRTVITMTPRMSAAPGRM